MKGLGLIALLFIPFGITAQDANPEEETVYTIVPEMPRFYNEACEQIEDKKERKKCADTAFLKYYLKNFRYPAIAGTACAEGRTVVSFVVLKNGQLNDIQIIKSLHPDFDQSAIDVVQSIPNFIPGRIKNEPVSVRINMPIRIQLQE